MEIVKKFLKYNVPEPIRMAHIYANGMKNKEIRSSTLIKTRN
ncbi:hypothetical protein MSIBF_A1110003 [groundwater metagenome]|uniref:Uncharacterized protein n=1 Tax=groundwater metagenome TaxID=717931 RepID=A0A098E5U5_9ZZZZ